MHRCAPPVCSAPIPVPFSTNFRRYFAEYFQTGFRGRAIVSAKNCALVVHFAVLVKKKKRKKSGDHDKSRRVWTIFRQRARVYYNEILSRRPHHPSIHPSGAPPSRTRGGAYETLPCRRNLFPRHWAQAAGTDGRLTAGVSARARRLNYFIRLFARNGFRLSDVAFRAPVARVIVRVIRPWCGSGRKPRFGEPTRCRDNSAKGSGNGPGARISGP